ncbi:hypothetical protein VTI74DRAFT_1823 [Chaetomium olivicolor]
MSCRQWLSSALRQCQSSLASQQPRAFSTTARAAALDDIFPSAKADASYRRARSGGANPNEALADILSEGMERGGPLSAAEQREVLEQQHRPTVALRDLQSSATTDNYLRQMPRRWKTGEVYAPRDLSPTEMAKWRKAKPPTRDIIDMLGFNPLDNYKNFSLISEFITPMGRIRHSNTTGLRPVNQRKMAKAIRRAIGMGLHPSVHHHPEILRGGRHAVANQSSATPTYVQGQIV